MNLFNIDVEECQETALCLFQNEFNLSVIQNNFISDVFQGNLSVGTDTSDRLSSSKRSVELP